MSEPKRIYATCDIGDDALDRLRERGYAVEIHDRVEPPPKALVLEKVRSGIVALLTTLRDRIDEEVFIVPIMPWEIDNLFRETGMRRIGR